MEPTISIQLASKHQGNQVIKWSSTIDHQFAGKNIEYETMSNTQHTNSLSVTDKEHQQYIRAFNKNI